MLGVMRRAVALLLLLQSGCHLVFGHSPSAPAGDGGASDRGPAPERPGDGPGSERGADLASDAGIDPGPPVCSPDGWCWENPRPHGDTIHSLWGSGPKDVHAVGGGGVTLHFDGITWQVAIPKPGRTLHKVWGLGVSEAYAVGESGTLLEWTTGGWTARASGTTSRLLAVGGHAGKIVAVGEGSVLLERTGAGTWSLTMHPALNNVLALRAIESWAGSVYLLGMDTAFNPGPVVISDEGGSWKPLPFPCNPEALYASWRAPDEQLWVGTGFGNVSRVTPDFTKCDSLSPGLGSQPVIALWGRAGNDVYALAAAVPGAGTRRYDGTGWSTVPTQIDEPHAIWGSGAGEVLVGGAGGRLSRGDAAGWKTIFPATGETRRLTGVWGSAPDDVYAVGGDASTGFALHFDGQSWRPEAVPPGTPRLTAVWGSGSSVYAVGMAGTILRKSKGVAFASLSSGTKASLEAIWGRSEAELFAVGAQGTFLTYTGGAWSADPGTHTADLSAVTGDATRIFVAGGKELSVLDAAAGAGWASIPLPPAVNGIAALALNASGELVAGGDGGQLCTRTGTTWSCSALEGSPLITALFRSGQDLYATGWDGSIARSGLTSKPVRMASGTSNWLRAGAAIGGHLYAVGNHGTILHRSP